MFKKIFTRQKLFLFIFLLFIFTLAFFLRVYFCYDKVFSDPIKYIADDGVYHMRLVENELLGNHFPRRIRFDPYTYFPYGTYHRVPPLYGQLMAGIIWLAGLGHPSLELINKIAPFYPAVLGSLMVFLIYFLAKAIWDRKVALLSAFLMAISPPYLFRSLLGTTDHHVAEVLFSTLAMMFLIFALKTKRVSQEIHEKSSLIYKLKRDLKGNKRFWLFTFLTGFSLGLYFLTWNGALLFLLIIFVFITLYYLIEYLSGRTQNWILFTGVLIFLITSVIILLVYASRFSNYIFFRDQFIILHLEAIILGIVGFILVGAIGKFIRRKKMNHWLLPVFLFLAGAICLTILGFISPDLFSRLIKYFQAIITGMVPYKFARELISEMTPLRLQGAFNSFSSLFYLSLVALGIILYKFIKKKKPEYLLILVWSLIIILMTGIIPFIGQRRYAYYLSFNISLLAGFLAIKGFEFGWRGLKTAQEIPLKSSIQPYFLVGSILIIFNVVFFLIFPSPLNIGASYPGNLPDILQKVIGVAKGGPFRREEDWYKTLSWLRESTPEPGVDYYAFYQEPGVDKKTGEINPYPYPQEAYGVLARWDVGSMITYYAHRIPNSNNFQQGIGKKEKGKVIEAGEGVFFLETNEERALNYLERLKTRYIITDYHSALPERGFKAKIKWLQANLEGYTEEEESSKEPSKFNSSMIARLHLWDGRENIARREVNGQEIEFYIEPLDHFRLVYESPTVAAFSGEDREEIKKVKIFEYVKGAKITGKTKVGTKITISTEVATNQGRKFVYQKSTKTTEDGNFEFVVPYSTFGKEGVLPNQTQFEVFAQPYKLKIGNKEIEINVSEEDILKGKTVKVSNF